MVRDVTITKVRALIFDLVNFKILDGDIYDVSKKYNLDVYHLANMRTLGWLTYDKKRNVTVWQIKERVNVEELTGIVIAEYGKTKKRVGRAKEAAFTWAPPEYKPVPVTTKTKVKKKVNFITKLKNAIYGILQRK